MKKKIIIISIVVLVLVAIGLTLYMAFFNNNKGNENKITTTKTASETTTTNNNTTVKKYMAKDCNYSREKIFTALYKIERGSIIWKYFKEDIITRADFAKTKVDGLYFDEEKSSCSNTNSDDDFNFIYFLDTKTICFYNGEDYDTYCDSTSYSNFVGYIYAKDFIASDVKSEFEDKYPQRNIGTYRDILYEGGEIYRITLGKYYGEEKLTDTFYGEIIVNFRTKEARLIEY